MRTLVFGKTGQVAQSLRAFFPKAVFLDRTQANFERPQTLVTMLKEYRPALVINAVAYTAVDRAEIEPGRAHFVNVEAPGEIAFWCKQNDASLIHYSTDYVYRGTGETPWTEEDPIGPLNRYGVTKLGGEREILDSGCHAIVLRTSWIYSEFGKNFLKTILKMGAEQEVLPVVNDQIGSPTYAQDLAEATLKISKRENFLESSGIYNLANSGWVSWYGFAKEIFAQSTDVGLQSKAVNLKAVSSMEFSTPAKRPLNSRLNTSKFKNQFGFELRPWQKALEECLTKID